MSPIRRTAFSLSSGCLFAAALTLACLAGTAHARIAVNGPSPNGVNQIVSGPNGGVLGDLALHVVAVTLPSAAH